jgi:hypothetical protein
VAYTLWDADPYDGIDSGLRDTVFSFNTSSSHLASWNVDGSEVGTFSVSSLTAVHSVILFASVGSSGMQFTFSSVQVKFYSSGTLVETVNVNDISADTRNSTSADGAAAAAVVSTSASNVTGVYVSASIQMKANWNVYPSPSDLFGQVTIS